MREVQIMRGDLNSFLYLADFWSSLFVHRVHRLHGSNSGFPGAVRRILGWRRPLYIQFRGPSEFMVEFYKKRNPQKSDFGSLFEARWGRFQLFLIQEWSSALERPCVRLSFSSLGGFWDPNLTSWRSFAVRLRFFVNFNFRVFQRAFVLARRHRPNSGFPGAVRMELAVCSWNSKGSSQLLDLPFQFLIQRSTLLFTDPPCMYAIRRFWRGSDEKLLQWSPPPAT